MSEQTDDPFTIALGSYYDAVNLYKYAMDVYEPNQKFLEQVAPELNDKIIHNFKEARKIRLKWKEVGTVPPGDEMAFREFLREVTYMVASEIDGRKE